MILKKLRLKYREADVKAVIAQEKADSLRWKAEALFGKLCDARDKEYNLNN